MKYVSIKNKFKLLFVVTFAFTTMFFASTTYAENIGITLNYGINKVAKGGNDLPIELTVDNRDGQDFKGYLTLNVYENNNSVFVYRVDLDIAARSTGTYYRNISITNLFNTVIINVYNRKEELVANERTNIDLSFYSEKLIVGVISSDYNSLSYIDNLILTNSTVQIKTVPIDVEKMNANKHYLDLVDMLIISDYDISNVTLADDEIYALLNSGKPVFIGVGRANGTKSIPSFLKNSFPSSFNGQNDIKKVNFENGIVVCTPYSFTELGREKDAVKKFIDLLEQSVDKYWILKLSNSYNSYLANDYYNVSNLLNIVDKMKLPDIFIISVLLLFYVTFLTIIIYVFLRNINQREQYGKYAIIFAIVYTIAMVAFGYSVMKKNAFLTYISIVNVKDSNAKETAFLNFRTSENGNYSFDTGKDIKLNPILMNNKQPIISLNFMDAQKIKSTIFTETDERKIVNVENARDFDSNVFVYENSSYLNDIYNIDSSFQRYDGMVTGRITNKMNLTIKNANILMFGKVIQIGDIEPNHSISLSRANSIGAPIGNNIMVADMVSDENNHNIVKYYLDENVFGYYDYALLFGFIDNNGTIDINSQDIGDVYGRTLIVTKINRDTSIILDDYCALERAVNNIEGYYDSDTNTINGDTEVINEYNFGNVNNISKVYFEGMDSYDHGDLDSYVPFYGNIFAYNLKTNSYDEIVDNKIEVGRIGDYLSPSNKIIIKFNPLSRDPLYRKISVPIVRALAER